MVLRARCAGAQSLPLSCSQADSDRLAVLEWNGIIVVVVVVVVVVATAAAAVVVLLLHSLIDLDSTICPGS